VVCAAEGPASQGAYITAQFLRSEVEAPTKGWAEGGDLGKKEGELWWGLKKTYLPTSKSPLGSFFLIAFSERCSKQKKNDRRRKMAEKLAVMILQAPAMGGSASKHPVPSMEYVRKHSNDVCKHSDV
jgi:hypothetical protein